MLDKGTYALQFGSHGVDVYKALRDAATGNNDATIYFAAVSKTLDEIAEYLREEEVVDPFFNGQTWIRNEKNPFLGDSIASLTLVVIYHFWQCSLFQVETGDLLTLVRNARAIVGHSVGLVSGAFLSYLKEGNLVSLAQNAIKYVAVLAARSRRAYLDSLQNLGKDKSGSPMLSVKGIDETELTAVVEEFRSVNPDQANFDIGILNGPGFLVLSGVGSDIAVFADYLRNSLDPPSDALVDLQFSAAFHSALLKEVLPAFEADRDFVRSEVLNDLAGVSVLATEDGSNLSLRENLYAEIARQVCVAPVRWDKTIRELFAGRHLEHVVDFGPGPLVRIFTQSCCKSMGRSPQIQSIDRLKNVHTESV